MPGRRLWCCRRSPKTSIRGTSFQRQGQPSRSTSQVGTAISCAPLNVITVGGLQLSAQQRAAILGEELLKKATEQPEPPVPVVPVKPVDLVAEAEKEAQKKLGDNASAARSQPYYLDVTHPQANKGAVVATLSKLLAIPPEQIATIGDMPNDVLMFHKSGFSIAMGNASDEVKAQASAVTDSNEQDGFAKAVRTLLLPE